MPGKVIRWLRRALLAFVALVLLLACTGAAYEAIGAWRDARCFPQRGRSVQAGLVKLNLDCSGQGSPAVILDSGGGVPAIGWFKVQPEVAKFTRVCSYDRAGYGWSDASPEPRTSGRIASELQALLDAAGEKGPYVLAGHSIGGFNVRVFAGRHPAEVAGVVLVDASHPDQDDRMNKLLLPAVQAQEKANDKRDEMMERYLSPLILHLGVQRLMVAAGAAELPGYVSKDMAQELLYLQSQSKARAALRSEIDHLAESAAEVRAAGNLGDRPLIVLTAGKAEADDEDPLLTRKDREAQRNLWINELQVEQSHLSTRGKQIIVPDSDHMIPFERPDAVVSAIREVWTAAREKVQ